MGYESAGVDTAAALCPQVHFKSGQWADNTGPGLSHNHCHRDHMAKPKPGIPNPGPA